MFVNRKLLLVSLLTGTLLLVQTALPWLHIGCEHDHSAQATATETHHHCHHHHGHSGKAVDSRLSVESRRQHLSSHDCAACRFLLLSSLDVQTPAMEFAEQVSQLPVPHSVGIAASEPIGLYRSRAPPALS